MFCRQSTKIKIKHYVDLNIILSSSFKIDDCEINNSLTTQIPMFHERPWWRMLILGHTIRITQIDFIKFSLEIGKCLV